MSCTSGITALCCLISCLANHCFMYLVCFFIASSGTLNSIPVTPSSGVSSQTHFLFSISTSVWILQYDLSVNWLFLIYYIILGFSSSRVIFLSVTTCFNTKITCRFFLLSLCKYFIFPCCILSLLLFFDGWHYFLYFWALKAFIYAVPQFLFYLELVCSEVLTFLTDFCGNFFFGVILNFGM